MDRDRQVEAEHGNQTAVALPKWFVYLASILLGVSVITVLPWVVWQTRAVMRLEIQMDTLAKIENKIDVILTLSTEIDVLERRLALIEEDVWSRKGLRWNKPDHEKYVQPKLESFEDRLRQIELRLQTLQNIN